ncbi:TLC domain-containing protein 4-B-like [Ipomoea triloba]|uniref:TLC domain-containing protein 4-B-like n=1 Tax=Ipomoea triloba TaxID=35885 RepID=UPI00125E8D1D|nr:TLC domain-containing protein 4-B-like [Ipomoea triloba]XP_031125994.1 TLC domain-containing protein 4-B-like [Ipomoea triloba]
MAIISYHTQAELLLKNYMLSDSLVVYSSVICGIFACKMVYSLSQMITVACFKGYPNLSKAQQVEWNNRSISTVHAIFITAMALHIAFWSDLFSDHLSGLITFRSSTLSTCVLGVSVGYFIADLGMMIWFYPTLGGMEYVVHHLLSMIAITYAMLTGEGQLYTFMVLVSEATTPSVNLRWYLDVAGMKKTKAYVINGVVMFSAWMVARILLFIYMFYHVYIHYNQVKEMHRSAVFLVLVVPLVLAILNLMWFGKIVMGLKKTLAKRD